MCELVSSCLGMLCYANYEAMREAIVSLKFVQGAGSSCLLNFVVELWSFADVRRAVPSTLRHSRESSPPRSTHAKRSHQGASPLESFRHRRYRARSSPAPVLEVEEKETLKNSLRC